MMEVSTEARFGIRGKLGGVLFVDGGNVWEGPWEVQLNNLRWAVGPGYPLRHADRPDAHRPWRSAEPHRGPRPRGKSGEAEVASTLQHRPGVLGVRGPAMRALRRLSRYVAIAVLSLVILLGAGVAVTQTSWFKNWLRQKAVSQAAQYLNGELTITRLSGNIFTGVALEGVALHHEGQTVVAMDRLSVDYSLLTMISDGAHLRLDDARQPDDPAPARQRRVELQPLRENAAQYRRPWRAADHDGVDRDQERPPHRQRSRPARGRSHAPQHAVPLCLRKAGHRDFDRAVFCGRRRDERAPAGGRSALRSRLRSRARRGDRNRSHEAGHGSQLQRTAGSAARHRPRCRAPVAAGDRPLFPAAREHQARAGGRRESARHARRAEHGRQRRVICGHGARAARRSFRHRSRRASAGGSTCATSTWRRFSIEPSGRRASPGRPTSRGRSARRRSISSSPVRMSRGSAIRRRTSARRACTKSLDC